jgi:hypothetical protein
VSPVIAGILTARQSLLPAIFGNPPGRLSDRSAHRLVRLISSVPGPVSGAPLGGHVLHGAGADAEARPNALVTPPAFPSRSLYGRSGAKLHRLRRPASPWRPHVNASEWGRAQPDCRCCVSAG